MAAPTRVSYAVCGRIDCIELLNFKKMPFPMQLFKSFFEPQSNALQKSTIQSISHTIVLELPLLKQVNSPTARTSQNKLEVVCTSALAKTTASHTHA